MAMQLPSGSVSRHNRLTHHLSNEINVTPMVDVMLVLLIIFMVTAPMVVSGVKVDLPDSAAKTIPEKTDPLEISVTSKGKIYLQDTQIKLDQLVPKLEAITNANTETRIYIRGDRKVNYGIVMQVIGAVNGAGFNKVALLTEPKQNN